MSNPKMKLENKKDVEFTLDTIGRPYITDSKVSYFEKHYRQKLNIEDYQSVKGNGCIYNVGSGKTTSLCNHWSVVTIAIYVGVVVCSVVVDHVVILVNSFWACVRVLS